MKKALKKGSKMIEALLVAHEEEINSAYLKDEDGVVSIGIKLVVEPGKGIGQKKLTTEINFVESRVKDRYVHLFDENQAVLQFDLEGEAKKTA